MKNKTIIFLLLLIILMPMFMVDSFAAVGMEYDCWDIASRIGAYGNFNDYIEEKYGIKHATHWVCPTNDDLTATDYEYPIVVSFPVKKHCLLDSNGAVYNCTYDIAIGSGRVGDITETNNEVTVYVNGYTIISSNKQLEMSEVDINIINGRVKVTGVLANDTSAWQVIYNRYKFFINGFTGMCLLSCVVAFIISFIKLGGTADSPTERQKVLKNIMISGFGTALLGAVLIFFGFFYNLF